MQKVRQMLAVMRPKGYDCLSRMSPQDVEAMQEIKRMYKAGELSHLTVKQVFGFACEHAGYVGRITSFREFLRA